MNDIIDGLNSCDCPTGLPGANFNNYNNNQFGCGFGSWIWILLILFYSGQGYGGYGGGGCCCKSKNDCCCGNAGYNNAGYGGACNTCGPYLFLLVILFLCGGGCGSVYGNNLGYGFNQGYDALDGCC